MGPSINKADFLEPPRLVPDFANKHLNVVPPHCLDTLPRLDGLKDALVASLKAVSTTPQRQPIPSTSSSLEAVAPPANFPASSPCYALTANLLNEISTHLCRHTATNRIHFFDHHACPPTYHPHDQKGTAAGKAATERDSMAQNASGNPPTTLLEYASRPDLVATRIDVFEEYNTWDESKTYGKKTTERPRDPKNFRGFPWHHTCSVVEIHSGDDNDETALARTAAYATDVFISRPEFVGGYGLYVRRTGYAVVWADWRGAVRSDLCPWDDLTLVWRYVWSLYSPPKTQHLDNSISLMIAESQLHAGLEPTYKAFVPAEPLWKIDGFPEKIKFTTIFLGMPYSRGTRVFEEVIVGPNSTEAPFIVKDVFISGASVRCKESESIKGAHCLNGTDTPSPVPGIVRGIDLMPPGAKLMNHEGNEVYHKERLLYFDSGKSLLRCENVYLILEVIFDLLAVHRIIVGRDVLHRDISLCNVYCELKWMDNEKIRSIKYITTVADADKEIAWLTAECIDVVCAASFQDPDVKHRPKCLLADFHLASRVHAETEAEKEDLQQRTGTALYTACAVQQGFYFPEEWFPQSRATWMPTISPALIDLYGRLYGDHVELNNKYMKMRQNPVFNYNREVPCAHQPRHDGESCIWLLAILMMRVWPVGNVKAPKHEARYRTRMTNLIYNSHFGNGDAKMRRTVLSNEDYDFAGIFQPGLSSITPLIADLAHQLQHEWEACRSDAHLYHVHEALTRILINSMHGPERHIYFIALDINRIRGLPEIIRRQPGDHGCSSNSKHPANASQQSRTSSKRSFNESES